MQRSLFLLPLLLTACPATDKPVDTDDVAPPCEVEIETTVPSSDAVDAYYRGNIEFHLSDPDPSATITTDIPGTLLISEDSETISWVPTAPLAPSTDYTVTLDYCFGSAPLSFRTSDLGTTMVTPADLPGHTYSINLGPPTRFVEPAGIGTVLASQLTQDILVGVQGFDTDGKILMIGAIGKEGVEPAAQEYCDPSIPFPAADFDASPYFQIGPETTTLSVAGYSVEIQNLEITGTFAADGSYFGGGTLSGTIDTRPLAPLLDDSGNEGAICDLAINFGAECQPCSDGLNFCLTLVADQITAEGVDGLSLVEVSGNNCTGCESGPPAEDAVCEQ